MQRLFTIFIPMAYVSFSSCVRAHNLDTKTCELSNNIPKRAIVIGATGATGKEVVNTLLKRNWNVTTVSRRPLDYNGKNSELLTEIISEFSAKDTASLVEKFKHHDALFNCLGTTRAQAGSAEAFVGVEVGLTKKACTLAKEAGVYHVSVVSAQGANKDLWVPSTYIHPMLYVKTLGEKEQAVINLGFPSITIFQPGMLNRHVGDRFMENVINWIAPSISLRVDDLALAMVIDAEKHIQSCNNLGDGVKDTTSKSEIPSNSIRYIRGNINIRNSVSSK